MSINPVRDIRINLGKSQRELASIAGVTEQVVLKSEQGLYPDLPPSILKAVAALSDLSVSEIDAAYRLWVNESLKKVVLPEGTIPRSVGGFKEWRRELCAANKVDNSVNALCKLLKLNPYVIQKFEGGKMKNVPLQVYERVAFIKGEL